MVRLFPGTDVHVEMAQDAAQHLARLLKQYNRTKADHRLSATRWRRFWRGIAPIERSLVVMYVQSNNGGEFYGAVELGDLPQALRLPETRRPRSCATDAVLREFANLRQIFVRACVNADEIALLWHTTHRDAMELCGPALTDSAATWLASDGSLDLGTALRDQLLSAGLAETAATQTAIELALHVRYLIQDRQKVICDRALGEEGVDPTDIAASYSGNPTTRERLVQARLGQGAYRDDLLALWGNACAVTGCSLASVVVASHAKPWAESTDDERLDPNNGLPLVATLDKLFDAGLIGFDPVTGAMQVASMVSVHDRTLLGVPAPLRRSPSGKQAAFLRYHLDHVFLRELAAPAVSIKR